MAKPNTSKRLFKELSESGREKNLGKIRARQVAKNISKPFIFSLSFIFLFFHS